MDDLQELTTEEIKEIAFGVLCRVRDICDEQGISYYLDGGTLIGAIRHGGFIPWDDDIDICMTRPDYDRFIAYCKQNDTPFGLISHEIDENYTELYAKAYDKNTLCKEKFVNRSNSQYGVYVDIFPVDGLGNSEGQALKLLHKSLYKRSLLTAANWQKYFKSKSRKWYVGPIRFIFYIFSRCVNRKKLIMKIEKIYKPYKFENCEKVGVVCGCYGDKEVMNRSIYDNRIEVKFETEKFKASASYDEFLTNLYGDYMQLPPEEKRTSHHTFTAYKKISQEKTGDTNL